MKDEEQGEAAESLRDGSLQCFSNLDRDVSIE